MSESRIVKRNQPCVSCTSSDAMQIYDDGHVYCFSCKYYSKGLDMDTTEDEEFDKSTDGTKKKKLSIEEVTEFANQLGYRGWAERKIPRKIFEFYDIKAEVDSSGNPVKFYTPSISPEGVLYGWRIKSSENVEFRYSSAGKPDLIGAHKFPAGGKRIIITEGVEDMARLQEAVMEHYKKPYPVVSLQSASVAKKVGIKYRDYLRSFEEVVFWLDNDEPGQEATKELAKIIGYDKVKTVKTLEKDADEFINNHNNNEAIKRIWEAQQFSPAGILSSEELWAKYQETKDIRFVQWPECLSKLNELTYGRALGSITMFAAGTGVGKSSLLREDMYHLLKVTPENEKIGGCFLEESPGETVASLLGIHLNKRIGLPSVDVTEEEERESWKYIFGSNRIMLLDHQGSVSDGSLLDKIEYMALVGCKYIYLDHITIAISESDETDTNKAIDVFMSNLLKLVKKHNVWVGVVSHLRKSKAGDETFETGAQITEDDLKGSGSLKQISFQTIALSRNKLSDNPKERNTTQVWLLKDRKTGASGPAGRYRFDSDTGRLAFIGEKSEDFDLLPDV
jgi:twinkle protein